MFSGLRVVGFAFSPQRISLFRGSLLLISFEKSLKKGRFFISLFRALSYDFLI